MKIIIFGTGSSAEKFVSTLDSNKVEVLGFSDNDSMKHHTTFLDHTVIPPEEIPSIDIDYIFIASQFSIEIMNQLLQLNISFEKIIPTDYINHNESIMKIHENINHLSFYNKRKVRKKTKIALTNYNYSNYNGYALMKYMPKFISEKYDVDLIDEKNVNELANYDVICSSLYEGIYDGKHINIELWHGFPLKRIGVMDTLNINNRFLNYVEKSTKYTDLVFSYSELYSTFFNGCFPSNISKYKITGMPRNDLLFEEGSMDKLEKVIGKKINEYNVVYYLPTWRKGKNPIRVDSSREWDHLFGFSDENVIEITEMVEKNNLLLIVKLHPYEYNLYKDLKIFKHKQVYLLSEEKLNDSKIHLYELLAASKILITDYSSIFFDTLLIDLPIIFAPSDLKEYRKNKGFLIEPYENFTPGPTVNSLKDLYKEVNSLLNGIDNYRNERKKIKEMVFKQKDNKSSLRVWKEIDSYLESL